MCALGIALAPQLGAAEERGAGDPRTAVTVYPASFFADAHPWSAFDMLALVPGFTFREADDEVRGFAAAGGNILIDGARPPAKQTTLEELLRRLPSVAVERIELIRAGVPGVDMQGQTLLANVVRLRRVEIDGLVEFGAGVYEHGQTSPSVAASLSHRSAHGLLGLNARVADEVDDEHGRGRRPRVSAAGAILRDTTFVQDEVVRVADFGVTWEQPLGGGTLHAHGSLLRERTRADIVEQLTIALSPMETIVERGDELGTEFAARYDRALTATAQLELLALRRDTDIDESEYGIEDDEISLSREDSRGSETILRGLVRRASDRWSIEGGLEGALNILRGESGLEENGVDVPLPSASVRVEERRAEVFTLVTWRIDPHWSVETGLRYELSEIALDGGQDARRLSYLKPRVVLAWTPRAGDRLRLLIERDVGQLDFEDFASSASLSTGVVTAGNPELVPESLRRVELGWEHRIGDDGALVLTLRHEDITDLVDRVPVIDASGTYDAVGNVGTGRRTELVLDLLWPLDRLGIAGGRFKATGTWRHSRVTDPATGRERRISEDVPTELGLHFTQELPRWRSRWGLDFTSAVEETEFQFNEIQTDRLGARVDLYAEFEPTPRWNVRFYGNNLTDRAAVRERQVHPGMRGSTPLGYIDTRTLRIGPYYGVAVRRVFGQD